MIANGCQAETSRGGPFPEIAQSDVLVNSVYLGANKAPPFLTAESLSGPERKLRTIADVSCDPKYVDISLFKLL